MQGLRLSGLPWLQPLPAASAARAHSQQALQQPPAAPAVEQPAAVTMQRQKQCPSQHAAQQRQVALWVGWLFGVLVAPLLRAHFYCTESEAYRQQVFYYRYCTASFFSCSQVASAAVKLPGIAVPTWCFD